MLFTVICFYAIYIGALYTFQDRLVYPADRAPAARPRVLGGDLLNIDIGADAPVYAVFLPAPTATAGHPQPAVMFFHGNAETIEQCVQLAARYQQLGGSVLLPEYRGYGAAGGEPSRPGIRADMQEFYDMLAARPEVDAHRIVLHGRSLGGAIAAELADQREPAALVIQSTFTSMGAMAHRYFAPGFLAKRRYCTDDIVAELDIPILIFHGSGDTLIPVDMGRTLHRLATDSVYVEYDCGHNNLTGPANTADYWRHIADFLKEHGVLQDVN